MTVKPVCPKCGKKALTHYIKPRGKEIPVGFYCPKCDVIVRPVSTHPPKVYRMYIRDFISESREKFDVILADPAWTYDMEATRESDRISTHYHQMTTEDICKLPVQRISAKDCYLFLWVTSPKMNDGMEVLRSWGFTYVTQMVWDKELMGLGHVVRQQHEILLIGRKGHPKPPAMKFRSVIKEKRTDHSRKPVKSYEIINLMFPEAKKIELFARWVYPGWTGVGDQAMAKPDQKLSPKFVKKYPQNFEVEVI